MKFLVDECLTPRVAGHLVAAGHDAVHVGDLGLLGSTDVEVMAAAVPAGRVVVVITEDRVRIRSLPIV